MTKIVLMAVASLVVLLLAVTAILRVWQTRLDLTPRTEALLPQVSPRAQLEFESGELATRLKREQGDRLNVTGDQGEDFMQVPVKTAIDWMVKHPREKGATP